MKQIYLLLIPLALTLACNKTFEYEYAVVCEFLPSFVEKSRLIVTAEDDTVLKEIEVAEGAASLNEKFTLSQREPNERINLHLIQGYNTSTWTSGSTRVLSCYSVRNGQSVSLEVRGGDLVPRPNPSKSVKVAVKDLSPFEQFDAPGCPLTPISNFPNPVFSTWILNGQGMALRLINVETQEQRWLFIQDEGLPDSFAVSAQQFAPATKQLTIYTPQISSSMEHLSYNISVYAVSPDLRHHLDLGKIQAASNDVRYVDLPNGLDAQWNFYLSVRSNFYAFEKIFPPEKPIQLSHPDVSIVTKTSVPGQSLSVKCNGPVDLLEAVYYTKFNNHFLSWAVMGNPTVFENLSLSESVQKYLPDGAGAEMFKTYYTVRAFSIPEYAYEGILTGFPWKSSDPFTAGRKGYEMVQK